MMPFRMRFFLILCCLTGCTKTGSFFPPAGSLQEGSRTEGTGAILSPHNAALLEAVLNGKGMQQGNRDGELVTFAGFTPPVVRSGRYHFVSRDDMDNFIDCLFQLQQNWDERDSAMHPVQYVDQAFQFRSLYSFQEGRMTSGFEEATAATRYLPDCDLQFVMNEVHEVVIGDSLHTYLGEGLWSVIKNGSESTQAALQRTGLAAYGTEGLSFYDAVTDDYLPIEEGTRGCNRFSIIRLATERVTVQPVANTSWEIRLFIRTAFNHPLSLLQSGDPGARFRYSIDWGDGSTTVHEGLFSTVVNHTYSGNFWVGNLSNYTIRVTASVVRASHYMLEQCSSIYAERREASIGLEFLHSVSCLRGRQLKEFHSPSVIIEGKSYRLKGLLLQRNSFLGLSRRQLYEASVMMQGKRNGRWVRMAPPQQLGLRLTGEILGTSYFGGGAFCGGLVKWLDESMVSSASRTLSIGYRTSAASASRAEGARRFMAHFSFRGGDVMYSYPFTFNQ